MYFFRDDIEHTNIHMDWTSLVLHGNEARLGKYGYSWDHRPDKYPNWYDNEPGNLNDQTHFKKTYQQSSNQLREGSLVIFDKGANSVANTLMIRADNLQYITGKKLNKSDDTIIAEFVTYNHQVINEESGIHKIKIENPNSITYLYFSKRLQKEQLETRARKVVREIKEAKTIQESIDKNKGLPKRFRINNLLVDVDYSIQTKLMELSEDDAVRLLEEKFITGREKFFCLKSSKN